MRAGTHIERLAFDEIRVTLVEISTCTTTPTGNRIGSDPVDFQKLINEIRARRGELQKEVSYRGQIEVDWKEHGEVGIALNSDFSVGTDPDRLEFLSRVIHARVNGSSRVQTEVFGNVPVVRSAWTQTLSPFESSHLHRLIVYYSDKDRVYELVGIYSPTPSDLQSWGESIEMVLAWTHT